MKYQELYQEYKTLLGDYVSVRLRIQSLPKGYITVRKISGKEYHYLQYTVHGKKSFESLREERVSEVRADLARAEQLQKQIDDLLLELSRLEQAVAILDTTLSRTFYFLKQCAEMDALPVEKRPRALSFAKAMTDLEGVPAQPDTERNLERWAAGELKFSDFYLPKLQRYQVMGGAV